MNKYLGTALLFFYTSFCFAQEGKKQYADDFQSWNSISISTDIDSVTGIELQQSLRFNNNASQVRNYFTELGIQRKLLKPLTVGSLLRYTNTPETSSWRIAPYLTARHKFDRFTVYYRLRWEYFMENEGNDARIRNRLSLKYNIKGIKLDPSIGYELFNNQDQQYQAIDRERMFVKLKYRIIKGHDVRLGYIIQRDINTSNPERDYILSFDYQIKL